MVSGPKNENLRRLVFILIEVSYSKTHPAYKLSDLQGCVEGNCSMKSKD
jgi:hypothetical protein